MTAKEFMKECVVPLAREARSWKAAQHNQMIDDLVGFLVAGKMPAKEAGIVLKEVANLSAFRQRLEAGEVIPKGIGKTAKGRALLSAVLAEDEAEGESVE